jgi:hypothetical protein
MNHSNACETCSSPSRNQNSIFMLSNLVKSWLNFKSQTMVTNCKNFHFFSLTKLRTHTMSVTKFQPMSINNHSFVACWMFMDMKHCPTSCLGHAILDFCLLACFYKLLNFGTNNFSLLSISLHILQWTMFNLPSQPITILPMVISQLKSFGTQFHSHLWFWCFFQINDYKKLNLLVFINKLRQQHHWWVKWTWSHKQPTIGRCMSTITNRHALKIYVFEINSWL